MPVSGSACRSWRTVPSLASHARTCCGYRATIWKGGCRASASSDWRALVARGPTALRAWGQASRDVRTPRRPIMSARIRENDDGEAATQVSHDAGMIVVSAPRVHDFHDLAVGRVDSHAQTVRDIEWRFAPYEDLG